VCDSRRLIAYFVVYFVAYVVVLIQCYFILFVGVYVFGTAGGTRRGNGCSRDGGLVPPGPSPTLVCRPIPGADAAGRRSQIPHRSSETSSAIVRRGNGCARDGGLFFF
jgi:hypothetical protein